MAKYSIYVRVLDHQGKPVPNVRVSIGRDVTTGITVPIVCSGYTNSQGSYISPPLTPGWYKVMSAVETPLMAIVDLSAPGVTVYLSSNSQYSGVLHTWDVPGARPVETPGILHPDGTTQTGALTSDKNFWLGLAIGGAALYLLLRR